MPRQEPKPTTKRDAEWAIIARAVELANYIRDRKLQHITEVKLIEAVDDYKNMKE